MKKWLVLIGIFSVLSCHRVALTGRRQLILIPSSEMHSMSFSQYSAFLKENKLSKDVEKTQMIKRCGLRIQRAVEQYMAQNNLSKDLEGFSWEFNLVDDPTVNAWCMPGGKVVFYTGILPVCENEEGVAVVMGHEIAHAIAKHGSERMSQGMLAQIGGAALSVALANKPVLTQQIFMQSVGMGTQLGMLKFSRDHESEADHMGLIFMSMAGYDPRNAPAFWQRMRAKGGQKPPEFLSTHPSDERRIAQLNHLMPEALRYYKKQ